jgi:mannose/cellobiose epimerase-like protein (N-acyl-D-glucosamine 2-epimerase family)
MAAHRLQDIEHWLFTQALPLWATMGVDPRGGFVEQLDLSGTPVDPGFKRMRVQARQVYVFCHAAELGWTGPAIGLAKSGIDFILENGWLDEGGWAFKLGDHGQQIDTTLYAYEQAFVLFAFGWYYRLTKDPEMLAQAHRTLDVMHARLDNPNGWGFLTRSENCTVLEQDPHMHFLEAMLIWYEATGEARFAEEARSILRLFASHIHQPHSAVLLEDFDLDWQSPTDPAHRRVEPGHHFEWIWLLWQAKRILGDDLMGYAPPLFAFADKYGSDTEGLVYDDALESGQVLNDTHRTWVQTEALKGYIAMSEYTGADHSARIAQLIDILLDRYLNTTVPGLWTDQPTAVSTNPTAPASTFYHLFLAFAEYRRFCQR